MRHICCLRLRISAYLLAKNYPRQASLNLVGNRYNLPGADRQLLHRGVFAPVVAAQRRRKLFWCGIYPAGLWPWMAIMSLSLWKVLFEVYR